MKRGRKNARCKAMERNTTTTITITTTTRETRAHIPGNDNDDGTILTEILYFWIFLVASPPPFLIQICYPPVSFSRSPSPSVSKPTTNYYDEDCTLSHRNTYLPTLRDSNILPPASVTFSRFLPLSLFLSSLSSAF